MRFFWLFPIVILLWSSLSAADTIDIINSSCTGTETNSDVNGVSINCNGNLTLINGSITSTTSISISTSGNLTIDTFSLTANDINLTAGSSMTLNSDVIVAINTVTLSGGSQGSGQVNGDVSSAGSTISINGVVYPISEVVQNITSGNTPISLPSPPVILLSSVPLPSAFSMLLMGMLMMIPGYSARKKA
jgi:hypothetical protein